MLHACLSVTRDEGIRAVKHEMARTVEDVLARRTRALFIHAKAAIETAPKVAEIMAKELGRDGDWIKDEVERFNKVARNYLVP